LGQGTGLLALAVALGLVAYLLQSGSPASRQASVRHPARVASQSLELTAQTVLDLPAPVSRAVALPLGQDVMILGGLTSSGSSASGAFLLDPASGALNQAGSLRYPVHDAAGAVLGGLFTVFGGGSPNTVATVQAIDANRNAKVLASLPQPRSDLAAVTVGSTVYLLGGYDGSHMTPQVLSTTDATSYQPVASLPVPVRYPAAAALDGRIYIFGGQADSGPTADIQELDTTSRSAQVVGHMPLPLVGASALDLGGTLYVVGGQSGPTASNRIWRFDPARRTLAPAGLLPSGVAYGALASVGSSAYLVGGENITTLSSVIKLSRQGGTREGGASQGAAFPGKMLIADRGNNRLIVVDASKHLYWTYPSATAPPPPGGFYFPDDAFFVKGGTMIMSNEEENHTIIAIAYPSGRVVWSYGHPGVPGSAPGYLNQPDDAYLLKNGDVTVADAKNCRILFISPQGVPLSQIGQPGHCVHDPPRYLGYPNGDTPLQDGNVLVSEINGSWVSEYTPSGQLVWTVHLPIAYPSDPQQIGPDLYIIADYSRPGGIYEFDREGQILWSYRVPAGPGMLDHPSLAEVLPNGLIGANDDYRHRVVVIDPKTDAIVWQYGVTDEAGTGPDQLNTPDGFDLLLPNGQTPHPQTG
jgi:outer membrane protein assembly factor BamB